MEVKTMVLDGIEYVLIPREVFEESIGVEQERVEPKISDFVPEKKVEEATKEEQDKSIIVESIKGVKTATGKNYEYRDRLLKQELVPEDVMVVQKSFQPMSEIPEIARNDSGRKIPAGKWGFYGPGAERDLG